MTKARPCAPVATGHHEIQELMAWLRTAPAAVVQTGRVERPAVARGPVVVAPGTAHRVVGADRAAVLVLDGVAMSAVVTTGVGRAVGAVVPVTDVLLSGMLAPGVRRSGRSEAAAGSRRRAPVCPSRASPRG